MGVKTIRYRQNFGAANTDNERSPNVWFDCPFDEILMGEVPGFAFEWHFGNFRTSTNVNSSQTPWDQGLKVFGSDGAVIAPADTLGGGATFSSDGDNEGVSVGQMIYPFQISRSHKKLWFEARIATSTVTDSKHGFFLGLIDASTLSATVPIAADGTLADENLVGFHRLEGDGDAVDTVYKADGVTQVTVGADAKTIAAGTAYKFGMRFEPDVDPLIHDPAQNGANKYVLSFYADNLRLADTKQIPSAAGTDFPNDARLGFVFALLNATASTPGSTTLYWVRVAQLI